MSTLLLLWFVNPIFIVIGLVHPCSRREAYILMFLVYAMDQLTPKYDDDPSYKSWMVTREFKSLHNIVKPLCENFVRNCASNYTYRSFLNLLTYLTELSQSFRTASQSSSTLQFPCFHNYKCFETEASNVVVIE